MSKRKMLFLFGVCAVSILICMTGCGKKKSESLSMADLSDLPVATAAPPQTEKPPDNPELPTDFLSIATTAAPTPKPTPTPAPTAKILQMIEVGTSTAPQAEHTPTAPIVGETEYNESQTETMRDMAVEYSKQMGLEPPYCVTYVESFRTAAWPNDADYANRSPNMPAWLYDEPTNRFAMLDINDPNSQYQTNAECLQALGSETASQIVQMAKAHAETFAYFNYAEDTKDTIASRLAMVYPPGYDITQDTEDLFGAIQAKEFHIEGFVLTDETLLYRDADGLYRVRCAVFKLVHHATQAAYEEMQCTPETWRELDVEVLVGVSDGAYIPLVENVVSPYYNVDPSMSAYIAAINANGYSYNG